MKETKPYSWWIGKIALSFLGAMVILGFSLLGSLLAILVMVLALMQILDWWDSDDKLETTTKKQLKTNLDLGIEAAQARRRIREDNSPKGIIFTLLKKRPPRK